MPKRSNSRIYLKSSVFKVPIKSPIIWAIFVKKIAQNLQKSPNLVTLPPPRDDGKAKINLFSTLKTIKEKTCSKLSWPGQNELIGDRNKKVSLITSCYKMPFLDGGILDSNKKIGIY